MNDIFKYILFILIISLIIAILCCNNDHVEGFSTYPFEGSKTEDIQSFEKIQDMIFKYEELRDTGKGGAINYLDHDRKKGISKKYKRLEENTQGDYMPYEKILPDSFSKERVKPKIKTQEAKIQLEVDITNKVGEGGLDNIKERSISGDIYFEPNACQGDWSYWDKRNCGDENNRCGIQFKKYEIINPEKNDENGPGKPCEYKDGEIKYKYCSGSGNDDYESNNERCATATNSCPCKLSNKNVMVLDGENVYDLEDENCNFERNIDCLCPPGFSIVSKAEICKLTPGIDCSILEPGCVYTPPSGQGGESCSIPNFMNEETEKIFYKNYTIFDGKCKEKKCHCNNGVAAEGDACLIDGLEICDLDHPCDEGYYYEGSPPTCKKQTDKNECSCLYGSHGIEDSNVRCSSDNFTDDVKIIQFCSSECLPGYSLSSDPSICNTHYNNPSNPYLNINCCVPDFNRCTLNEGDLINNNIIRKEVSNKHRELLNMNLHELLEEYETLDDKINQDNILKKDNPNQFLIKEILEKSDGSNTQNCINRIPFKECMNNFKCKEGYSFLPKTEYISENELRMVGCEGGGEFENICTLRNNCEIDGNNDKDCGYPSNSNTLEEKCRGPHKESNIYTCGSPLDNNKQCYFVQEEIHNPIWNGTCVPVNCQISSDVKELYNIPYDICSSNDNNCGLSTVTCKKEEYNEPNTNKMIYCPSPYKVDNTYLTKDYSLIHLGCSLNPQLNEATQARRQRMQEGSDMISQEDASVAQEQVSTAGISTENIDTPVDFGGTTSQAQLDLETQIEETRVEIDQSLESEYQVERDQDARERLEQATEEETTDDTR